MENMFRSVKVLTAQSLLGLSLVVGSGLAQIQKVYAYEHGSFMSLYNDFANKGVPRKALKRLLEFMDLNYGKTIQVRGDGTYELKKIGNDQYVVLIDFTKPSSQRRMYLLDLKNITVGTTYVAHGAGSGNDSAVKFSNINESKMSSLGFYITGGTYVGRHGKSIYLYGTEKSNDLARKRMIVIHAADYVSEQSIKSMGRLGRSWGCPAVSPATMKTLLATVDNQTVVYAHHDTQISM